MVLGSVILGAAAQLLLKGATLMYGEVGDNSFVSLLPVIAWLGTGLVCYAASMIFWLFALSRYELSLAYPVLGLGYPLVFFGALFCPFFGEALAIPRVVGIGLILIGVTLVTRTATTESAS